MIDIPIGINEGVDDGGMLAANRADG